MAKVRAEHITSEKQNKVLDDKAKRMTAVQKTKQLQTFTPH